MSKSVGELIILLHALFIGIAATSAEGAVAIANEGGYRVAWVDSRAEAGLCEAVAGNSEGLAQAGWKHVDFLLKPFEITPRYAEDLRYPKWTALKGERGDRMIRNWARYSILSRFQQNNEFWRSVQDRRGDYIPQIAEIDLDSDGDLEPIGRILSTSNKDVRWWVRLDSNGDVSRIPFFIGHGGGLVVYKEGAYLVYGSGAGIFVRSVAIGPSEDVCLITDLPEHMTFAIAQTWSGYREYEGCSAMVRHLNNLGRMFTYDVPAEPALHIDDLGWSDIELPARKGELVGYLLAQEIEPGRVNSYREKLEFEIDHNQLVAKEAWTNVDDDPELEHLVAIADARVQIAHAFSWSTFIGKDPGADSDFRIDGQFHRPVGGHLYRYKGALHSLEPGYDVVEIRPFCRINVANKRQEN